MSLRWSISVRISSYLFKLTANQFNHNILCPYWICFFIGKSESGIWGPWLWTKKFDISPTVAIFVDASKINKKIFFWKIFQGTRNGTFWLSNEKTNCIWTNLEEIGDNCGWFKLLWTYSSQGHLYWHQNFEIWTNQELCLFFFKVNKACYWSNGKTSTSKYFSNLHSDIRHCVLLSKNWKSKIFNFLHSVQCRALWT